MSAAPLDTLVVDAIIERVSGRRLATTLRRADEGDDGKVAAELAAAESRLEELAADYAAGEISRREWMAARDKSRERIAAASRLLDARCAILADLPRDEHALRKELDVDSPLERRRPSCAPCSTRWSSSRAPHLGASISTASSTDGAPDPFGSL